MAARSENRLSRAEALRQFALKLATEGSSEVSKDQLGGLQPALDELIDEGALVEHDDTVRFFHETFRDFVIARAFVEAGKSLLDVLTDGPQDLSQRPLVRRVLGYQRGLNRQAYRIAVSELLEDKRIRFHIRDVVFEIMRTDPAPEPADWSLLRPYVLDEQRGDHQAAWSVAIQAPWYRLLDRMGLLIRWMASDDLSARNRATTIARVAQRDDPRRVAELLFPFIGVEGDWTERLKWIVHAANVPPDRRYIDFLCACIESGLFDDQQRIQADSVWMSAHELATQSPDLAIELVDTVLRHGLALAGDRPNPFNPSVFAESDYWADAFLAAIARHDPRRYAQVILPRVCAVADATATKERSPDGARHGDPWTSGLARTRHREFKWHLFASVDAALRALAQTKPRSLRSVASILLGVGDIASMRHLLYHAWMVNPEQFSADALTFLERDIDPFVSADFTAPYSTTRELIASLQPHASPSRLQALERRILGYVPPEEREVGAQAMHRYAQWQLLEGFDPERLSDEGRRRLLELRRKFGSEPPEPMSPRAGFVRSPIDEGAASRMTDEQWLSAIAKYHEEDISSREDFLTGGALELSRVLETEAKKDPDRFARLAARFPGGTNEVYFDAVLRALADADRRVSPGLLIDVLRHCFRLPGKPGGRWINRAVARVADDDLPDDVLQIVAWFATEASDPVSDSFQDYEDDDEKPDAEGFGTKLLTAGINSVRGAAAEGLGALLWHDESRVGKLSTALRRLVRDPTLAVRSCAPLAVSSVLRHDTELATELFKDLVDADDRLLGVPPVEELAGRIVRIRFTSAADVVDRMLGSPLRELNEAGGRLAAFGRLYGHEEASSRVADAFVRGPASRTGVAQVAAANVGHSDYMDQCSAWLLRLFGDDAKEVREAASDWCRSIESSQLADLSELAGLYIDSPAYADDEWPMLRLLDESPAAIADLALRAIELLLERRRTEIGDLSRSAALSAAAASKLALRAYTSAKSGRMRNRALDLIDRLLAARVSDMTELVGQVDERFHGVTAT